MDSTPAESTFGDGSSGPDQSARPPVRSRTVVLRMLIVGLVVWAFFATGLVDAGFHAIAHAFPDLMLGGCGGG